MNFQPFAQQIVIGAVLVAAVYLDQLKRAPPRPGVTARRAAPIHHPPVNVIQEEPPCPFDPEVRCSRWALSPSVPWASPALQWAGTTVPSDDTTAATTGDTAAPDRRHHGRHREPARDTVRDRRGARGHVDRLRARPHGQPVLQHRRVRSREPGRGARHRLHVPGCPDVRRRPPVGDRQRTDRRGPRRHPHLPHRSGRDDPAAARGQGRRDQPHRHRRRSLRPGDPGDEHPVRQPRRRRARRPLTRRGGRRGRRRRRPRAEQQRRLTDRRAA